MLASNLNKIIEYTKRTPSKPPNIRRQDACTSLPLQSDWWIRQIHQHSAIIHWLMERDTDIHIQEPGWDPGVYVKRGRREHMSKGGQDHNGEIFKELNQVPGNSWTLDLHLWRFQGTKLGHPYVGHSCESWSSRRAPGSRTMIQTLYMSCHVESPYLGWDTMTTVSSTTI